MRTSVIWAVCAALSVTPALAQPGVKLSPQQAQPGQVGIATVVVAEIDSLPQTVRKQVDAQIARMSDDDLGNLRRSLAVVPAASVALSAKGKNVTNVVAAALDDTGALLLVTTTAV